MHFHRFRFVYDWIDDRHKPSLEMAMAHSRNKNKRIGCTMDRLVQSHFAFTLRTSYQKFNTKFNWIKSTGMRLWLIRLSSRPIFFRFHSNNSNNCFRWRIQWKWSQCVALSRDSHFVYCFCLRVSLAFVLVVERRRENFMRIKLRQLFFRQFSAKMLNENYLNGRTKKWMIRVFAWNGIHPSLYLTDNGIYLCLYFTLRSHPSALADVARFTICI